MALLTVANLQHAYGSHLVLDGATISIDAGEKVGLVGRNGSGKTTLMNAMLGRITPDSGSVQLARGARVGYLSQQPQFDPEDTVRDAAERAFAELHDLHVKARELYEQMALATGDELDRLMRQQARIDLAIEAAGGYAIDHRIDAMLHGLGFADAQFSQRVTQLSGGQKNRLGLARLLLEQPDLLLLDEPTNHLDIDGRRWLEEFLAEEYPGAVIVVSHDRWLLDRVVSRIIEVHNGEIREYPGNYHKFVELRRERHLTQARVYDKQLDKIRREEAFIRRYKAGQRAKQARGRESRLDRFKRDELVDRPLELDVMNMALPTAPRSGDQVVIAEGISKQFGELRLFERLDLNIQRGDRVGIIGPNGCGKTTLVKVLLGDLEPDEGKVRLGSRLSVGYYRQTHEHLDMTLTIWEYLQRVIVALDGGAHASEQQARDLAGAFLFSGDEQDKLLADVSGGERSRAVLAGLVASAKNLLVLDEPSNHLDIPSAERLEQALSREGGYEGTLLLISHDRALLDATCEKLIVFDGNGGVHWFEGHYSEWIARAERESESTPASSQPRERQPKTTAKLRKVEDQSTTTSRNSSSLSLPKLESKIEELEDRISRIDAMLFDPEVYKDGPRCKSLHQERESLKSELLPLESEWARRAEQA